jgi:hypothetical protein
MDNCRTYMCQQYVKKYGDGDKAALKLREVYKMSDEPTKCYRKDTKTNKETKVADLSADENWLISGFANKGWCTADSGQGMVNALCGDGYCDCGAGETQGNCPKSQGGDCLTTSCQYTCGANGCEKDLGENAQNCPGDCGGGIPQATITLSNCVYNTSEGSITCDTNCLSDPNKGTTLFLADQNTSRYSPVSESGNYNGLSTGNLTLASGKLVMIPKHAEFSGENISYSLSEYGQDTSYWAGTLTCKNPVGTGPLVAPSKV